MIDQTLNEIIANQEAAKYNKHRHKGLRLSVDVSNTPMINVTFRATLIKQPDDSVIIEIAPCESDSDGDGDYESESEDYYEETPLLLKKFLKILV